MSLHAINESHSSASLPGPGGRRRARPTWVDLLIVLALAMAVSAGLPRGAGAAGQAAADAVAEMNKRAMEEYDNLDFDQARKTLTEALQACQQAGLTKHAVAAEAHLLMGIVIFAGGVNQRDEATEEFRQALAIRPTIEVPERLASPEIREVFADAVARNAEVVARPADSQHRDGNGGITATRPPRGKVKPAAVAKAASETDAEADGDADEESETASSRGAWFVGLGAGSGLGWTSGNGEVTDARVQAGFRPAAVAHVRPEIGYFITPDLLLSAQLRVQFVSGASSEPGPTAVCGADQVCSASKGATAAFAKAAWFLGQGTVRPYLAGMLGFGQIRHVVAVPGVASCGSALASSMACTDTVAAGPVFIGPGGGVMINLARHFALVVGAGTLLGFPRFTFHVDLDAGVAVEL